MNIDSLLNEKLKRDLIFELNNHYKKNTILNKNYTFSEFNKIIKDKIHEKIIINKIIIDSNRKSKSQNKNQCCSRIMGPRYSDIRCSSRCYLNNDYCKKHLKRLNEYGYLSFGRYDQLRPKFNEKKNKIPWRDVSIMNDLDIIIQFKQIISISTLLTYIELDIHLIE